MNDIPKIPHVNGRHYRRKLKEAKLSARSNCADWSAQGLHKIDFSIPFSKDTVPRINYSTNRKEFIRQFEEPNIPCVITGALENWNLANFSIEKLAYMYRHEKFKVGEDDDGKTVYMGLKYYLHYALKDEFGAKIDDSPLYIFDPTFGKRTLNHSSRRSKKVKEDDETTLIEGKHRYSSKSSQATCHIVDDYAVPKYFTDDLFKLAGARRPPFRWLVIGPSRSGTGIHVDPLGTSAWNALVSGHKKWVMFPPVTDKSIVDPKLIDGEASTWFSQVYPKFIKKDENGTTLGDRLGMVDLIQKPGETVFVPGGWYHIVMNLDFAIAVTQNFCSTTNLDYVWLKTRFSRPRMAAKLKLLIQKDLEIKKSNREIKAGHRLKHPKTCLKVIEKLEMVPMLPTSSSGSSSSSSSESESDSDQSVICECHGKKRRPS